MTEKEAADRGLPAEIDVVVSEDRDPGPEGDHWRPWHMAHNVDAVPPDHMFMFIDKSEWDIDFFTIYGGIVSSEKFLALLQRECADNIHISRLTLVNKADRELPNLLYFVKFTILADVIDFDKLDFNGAYHDIIGGPNELFENDRGMTAIKRSASIAFIDDKPEVFIEATLPGIGLPLFCGERFKADCEKADIRGLWFWPESELLVVDFILSWNGQFEDATPRVITRTHRNKWKANVDRSSFFHPENVHLSPAHQEIMRLAAKRMKRT